MTTMATIKVTFTVQPQGELSIEIEKAYSKPCIMAGIAAGGYMRKPNENGGTVSFRRGGTHSQVFIKVRLEVEASWLRVKRRH